MMTALYHKNREFQHIYVDFTVTGSNWKNTLLWSEDEDILIM